MGGLGGVYVGWGGGEGGKYVELPSFSGWHPYPSEVCQFCNNCFSECYIVVIFPDIGFISFYQLTLANLRDL